MISFAGGVLCSRTTGENSMEKQVTYNTDTESEDRLNKVLEEVERIILDLHVYTSSSWTGGRMRRDTDRDWSVFWVVFYFVLLLVSNFNIYRYILFFKFFSSISCSVAQSCPTLWDPMNPPGSSVHGIFQARMLEWVAISFSKGSSHTRDQTHVSCISCIGKQILYITSITWEVTTS